MNAQRVNWEMIFQESCKGLGDAEAMTQCGSTSASFLLREYRTIWMGSGRQTGLTQWVKYKLIANENHLVIVKDRNIRDDYYQFLRGCSKPVGRAYSELDVKSIHAMKNPDSDDPLEELRKHFGQCDVLFIDDCTYVGRHGVDRLLSTPVAKDLASVLRPDAIIVRIK